MLHPFLQNDFHIKWATLTPEHIETDIGKALDQARSAVDTVAAQQPPLTYTNTIAALDEGLETLNRAWGLVSHLDSVNNSPELRAAHNAMISRAPQGGYKSKKNQRHQGREDPKHHYHQAPHRLTLSSRYV